MSHQRGITLYMHMHQPWRVKQYSIFDVASDHGYFERPNNPDQDNQLIFNKVARKSYLPMNELLLELLQEHPEFKLSLSISGTVLEQAKQFNPEVISSIKRLVDTGRVEIVAGSYYHSLAFFYDQDEFTRQVNLYRDNIRQLFGVESRVFANTELAYNNDLAKWAEDNGFTGILAEGWDPVLGWRSPNYVYRPAGTEKINLLMKNYRLSDDLAFRFSDQRWAGWPLTAEKYMNWLTDSTADSPLVNLFMDYETFGEHQWAETGIFDFFRELVRQWLSQEDRTFYTVSGAISQNPPVDEISVSNTTTWADSERDLTAWNGNAMQREAFRYLYALESDIMSSEDLALIGDWRRLQTSDHMYYMSTKWFKDGDVHAYFSPYKSPYDAFLHYMNAIRDLRWRLATHRNGEN